MKGDLTLRILDTIGDTLLATSDLIEVLGESGYGASAWEMEKDLTRRSNRRKHKKMIRQQRQRLYRTLHRLKSEGLLKQEMGKWKITILGKEKAKRWSLSPLRMLPSTHYKIETSPETIIVIFDVPERVRYKRRWLRTCLTSFGFLMLQKSVWIGKIKIPKEFIVALDELKLIDAVEIFSINKKGTVQKQF